MEGYVFDPTECGTYDEYFEYFDKYDFDIETLIDEEGEQNVIKYLNDLIARGPFLIHSYEKLCLVYSFVGRDIECIIHQDEGVKATYKKIFDDNGKLPELFEYVHLNNRPLIRFLNYHAESLWLIGKTTPAIELFKYLMRSNPNDNIGARYSLLAVLEKIPFRNYRLDFLDENARCSSNEQEKWFEENYKKHPFIKSWVIAQNYFEVS